MLVDSINRHELNVRIGEIERDISWGELTGRVSENVLYSSFYGHCLMRPIDILDIVMYVHEEKKTCIVIELHSDGNGIVALCEFHLKLKRGSILDVESADMIYSNNYGNMVHRLLDRRKVLNKVTGMRKVRIQ